MRAGSSGAPYTLRDKPLLRSRPRALIEQRNARNCRVRARALLAGSREYRVRPCGRDTRHRRKPESGVGAAPVSGTRMRVSASSKDRERRTSTRERVRVAVRTHEMSAGTQAHCDACNVSVGRTCDVGRVSGYQALSSPRRSRCPRAKLGAHSKTALELSPSPPRAQESRLRAPARQECSGLRVASGTARRSDGVRRAAHLAHPDSC